MTLPVVVNGAPTAALSITPNPTGPNTPVRFNASRVDRSQRGCAQLLVGPQRRPDVRRRRRPDPDASLCRARHAQGGSQGDRRPWWHRHGRRLRDRSPGQAADRRGVGEPGRACRRRDRDLHRDRGGPGWDGRRDPMGPRRRRAVRRRHGCRRDAGLQHARVEDRGRAGGGQHGRGDDRLSNDRRDGVDGDPPPPPGAVPGPVPAERSVARRD